MNIPLKKHQAEWIADQVSSGRYETELEAIEDAIAAKMREDEAQWLAARDTLRERLRQAEDDLQNGHVVVADDAFWDDIQGRIDQVEAAGKA